jgi:hypothetical protein
MWALLPVKPTASGFTDHVFLIFARFTPSSLPALFQGFWILSLISSLGPWGYTPDVDFATFWEKIPPLSLRALFQGFWILSLISTLGHGAIPQL